MSFVYLCLFVRLSIHPSAPAPPPPPPPSLSLSLSGIPLINMSMGYQTGCNKDGAVYVYDITDIPNSNHFYSNYFQSKSMVYSISFVYRSVRPPTPSPLSLSLSLSPSLSHEEDGAVYVCDITNISNSNHFYS